MTDQQDARVALALAALAEITDPADVGPLTEVVQPEPGVVDLRFACAMAGYPDWAWTVSTSALEGVAPTVLEVELLPGDGALLAPPWVPWTERLAEWRRTHDGAAPDGDEDDGLDEEDGLDEDDELDEDADEDEDALEPDALDPDDDVDDELGDDVEELDDGADAESR